MNFEHLIWTSILQILIWMVFMHEWSYETGQGPLGWMKLVTCISGFRIELMWAIASKSKSLLVNLPHAKIEILPVLYIFKVLTRQQNLILHYSAQFFWDCLEKVCLAYYRHNKGYPQSSEQTWTHIVCVHANQCLCNCWECNAAPVNDPLRGAEPRTAAVWMWFWNQGQPDWRPIYRQGPKGSRGHLQEFCQLSTPVVTHHQNFPYPCRPAVPPPCPSLAHWCSR